MTSLGGYPAGAAYASNAPWNTKEPEFCICEECGGSGKTWWRYDIEANESTQVTEEEYNALPTEQEALEQGGRYCQYQDEVCEACGGEGEYEAPEYEWWDE